MTLTADPAWAVVDFLSDLHLQAGEPETAAAWMRYLASTPADALFILGDLFEAWPGDDCALTPGFAADCVGALQAAGRHRAIHVMHGNRDFLLGPGFARQAGVRLIDDPCVLVFGAQRLVLSHGDALCLADTDYLRFRAEVRTPAWAQAFLARPLAEREAVAREMRARSQARQREMPTHADADARLCRQWLEAAGAQVLVHGHTHRPADHDLGSGYQRRVLSDWEAGRQPPRLEVLRVTRDGRFTREPVEPA
jgi:UDP-2,3-diacylglucosamine hydrolase